MGVELVRGQAIQAKNTAAVKAKELYTATGDLVSQKSFQTTTASAAAGGMALGAGGALGGGMAGYGVYQRKDELMNAGNSAVLKANNGVEVVKGQVSKTVGHARDRVYAVKTRLAGGEAAAMNIVEATN